MCVARVVSVCGEGHECMWGCECVCVGRVVSVWEGRECMWGL